MLREAALLTAQGAGRGILHSGQQEVWPKMSNYWYPVKALELAVVKCVRSYQPWGTTATS